MRPAEDIEVYLCREVVDFRKSINGLSVIVEEQLGLSPFGPQLFVFCNRRRDKLKILYWERSGFVLWYKRLEKQRFPWPRRDKTDVLTMAGRELNWLLDGIGPTTSPLSPPVLYSDGPAATAGVSISTGRIRTSIRRF